MLETPEKQASEPLRRALVTVECAPGEPLPVDVHRWLAAGVRSWLEATGDQSLEVFLGLERSDRFDWARMRRRMLLRRIAVLLDRDPDTWSAAAAVLEELEHFRRTLWPAWRALERPPSSANELHAAAWVLKRMEIGVPSSQRGLFRAMTDC